MGGFVEMSGRGGVDAPKSARVVASLAIGVLSLVAVPGLLSAQERTVETEVLESARQAASHTVQRGDTLWDLAGFYLSNPFGWPRIYEINTSVIEDPHWIYPGEILALPDAVAVSVQLQNDPLRSSEEVWEPVERSPASTLDRQGLVSGFGGPTLFDTSPFAGNLLGGLGIDVYGDPALVLENDFRRAPMLVEKNDYVSYGKTVRKIGANPLHMRMPPAARLHAVVVIELRDLSVQPGDELRAIRWRSGVRGLEIGQSLAMLKVLNADDEMARAVVTRLYGDFSIGDAVILAEPFTVPETLQQVIDEDGLIVELIAVEIKQALVGEGDMVFIDAGAAQGVRIGDEFVFFDRRDGADAPYEDHLATVRIVRVDEGTATGRLIDLRDVSPEKGSPGRRVRRAVGP